MNNAGTIIAITAYTDDDAGTNAGAVYVYTVDSMGVWSQQQKIIGNDTVSGDYLVLMLNLVVMVKY